MKVGGTNIFYNKVGPRSLRNGNHSTTEAVENFSLMLVGWPMGAKEFSNGAGVPEDATWADHPKDR